MKRCLGLLGIIALVWAAQLAAAEERPLKDPDGNPIALVVLCNDCQNPKSKSDAPCDSGAEKGWLNGNPCGSCLIDSNWGTLIKYGYDLHFVGTLHDAAGQPVKDRFVKLFLPNGWSVRTRTSDEGSFRLMLGATDDRQGQKPVVMELGTLVDSTRGDDPQFAMYLMPTSYKPCDPNATKAREAATKPHESKRPAAKAGAKKK